MQELVALVDGSTTIHSSDKAIRIIVMHHPPHYFDTNPMDELTAARVLNCRDLLSVLARKRFHIIVAGHRHAINPPTNYSLNLRGNKSQPPLPNDTIQLVAGTATQLVTDPAKERPSMNLYEISIDYQSNTFSIERSIYEHENDLDNHFNQKGQTQAIINNLPI